MNISISTAGLLDEFLPPGSDGDTAELEVDEGATLLDVLTQLGVPADKNYLVAINGEVVARSERARRVLADHDSLTILPPVKGG